MAALEKLYAGLPTIACRRKCQASCHLTHDLLGVVERDRLAESAGLRLESLEAILDGVGADLWPTCAACPLLQHGACVQHPIRPLMCRLWGVVDDDLMRCPHGCRPEPGYLTNRQVRVLWARMAEIDRRYAAEVDNPHRGIHEA